jgi:hypothetical protein
METQSQPQLTKVQRNQLYKAVEKAGLDLAQCELTENLKPESAIRPTGMLSGLRRGKFEPQGRMATVAHLPSGSSFSVEQYDSGDIALVYTSIIEGTQRSVDTIYRQQLGFAQAAERAWQVIVDAVARWAAVVKRECVDPDYWSELQRGTEFLVNAQGKEFGNTPFTVAERRQIAHELSVIKEYVKRTYSLSLEQMEHIDTRFDEAEAASSRMGRKDWLLLFGGAILSLVLSYAVPPEAVQHVLTMTAHSLGQLFGTSAAAQLPPNPEA